MRPRIRLIKTHVGIKVTAFLAFLFLGFLKSSGISEITWLTVTIPLLTLFALGIILAFVNVARWTMNRR